MRLSFSLEVDCVVNVKDQVSRGGSLGPRLIYSIADVLLLHLQLVQGFTVV